MDESDNTLGHVVNWVNAIANRIHSAKVITLNQGICSCPQNTSIHSLGKERHFPKVIQVLRLWIFTLTACARNEIDAIFCHMTEQMLILIAPIAKIFRKPLMLWYAHQAAELPLKMATKLSNAILTPTAESFPLHSKKIQVIGHGIDVREFNLEERKITDPSFILLAVGRITPIKDLKTIIRALAILISKKGTQNTKLQIIGEPKLPNDFEYKICLEKEISNYNLASHVQFIGSISRKAISSSYRTADILVHASRTGSLDKALVEAMASYLIPISSNKSFCAIMQLLGLNKLTFSQGNSKELAERVEHIVLMSEHEKEQIRLRLRDHAVTNHNLTNLADKIVMMALSLMKS